MFVFGRASSPLGSRTSGRTVKTSSEIHISRTKLAGSTYRAVKTPLPIGLGRSLNHLSRKLRLDEAKLHRRAELDYVEYRHLNGAVVENNTTATHSNGFSDLDGDIDDLDKAAPRDGLWQKLTDIRSFFAYLFDPNEFGKRGEGLCVLTVVLTALAFFPPVAVRGWLKAAGVVVAVYGAVSAIAGVVALGSSFSPLPVPRREAAFVSRGVFRFVRHPFYAGLLSIALGCSAITVNEFRLFMTCVLYWLLEQIITGEEKDLEATYPEYPAYRATVAKLIPFVY